MVRGYLGLQDNGPVPERYPASHGGGCGGCQTFWAGKFIHFFISKLNIRIKAWHRGLRGVRRSLGEYSTLCTEGTLH